MALAISLQDIEAAQVRIGGQVVQTPCQRSHTLSLLLGAEVYIKFENQQFTASFKERGALNCLLCLSDRERQRGVVAMSAGNHAQALAYHGRRLDTRTTIVMPRSTPNAKVEQTRVHGAEVILHGSHFDETREFTATLAEERQLTLVHPYDDPRVMAGQGTVGLEIMSQVADVDAVFVPVGGGGLISGVALAVKSRREDTQVIGVQMERFSGAADLFHHRTSGAQGGGTVAEGIAVKSPGANTLPVIERFVDDMLTVSENAVEQAVYRLLEIEKTVAEGAGAASLAALEQVRERFAGKRVVLIVSGGNIDMMILSSVLQRGLVRNGQLVRLQVEIPDVPGALAELTRHLGELDSNIMDIVHQRAFGGSSVRATVVELVLQLRGEEQEDLLMEDLMASGYDAKILD